MPLPLLTCATATAVFCTRGKQSTCFAQKKHQLTGGHFHGVRTVKVRLHTDNWLRNASALLSRCTHLSAERLHRLHNTQGSACWPRTHRIHTASSKHDNTHLNSHDAKPTNNRTAKCKHAAAKERHLRCVRVGIALEAAFTVRNLEAFTEAEEEACERSEVERAAGERHEHRALYS